MIEGARTGRCQGLAGTLRLPGTPPPVDDDGIAIRPGTGLTPSLDEARRARAADDDGRERHGPRLAGPRPAAARRDRVAHGRARAPGAARRGDDPRTDDGTRRPDRHPGPRSAPSWLERARQHPYVRLALNPSFSALWTGQIISLFGDRVNQIALAAFVYEVTKSPLAVALTFFVGMVPNLILSPIAGAFVDRWDQKQVLVVSDILRAAAVMLLPVAVLYNVWLAYPVVFVLTTISIFFRPARQAILPRIVPEEDLLAANSAMWVGETLADVINYPIAGLFVVFLAVVARARLLVRRGDLPRLGSPAGDDGRAAAGPPDSRATRPMPTRRRPASETAATEARPSVVDDLKTGWAFLRQETVLLANTLQGTAGQFSLGVLTVASLILAEGDHAGNGRRLPRHVRLHGDRHRRGQPGRRVHAGGRRQPRPQGQDDHRGLHRVRRGRDGRRRRRQHPDRAGTVLRDGHRQHGVRDPEPDAVPGADAARAHGSRGEPPVRAGVRRDEPRHGARRRGDDRGRPRSR